MKKHILLISTFILSFVLLVGNVNAAAELTCTYGEEVDNDVGTTYQKRIIQYEDGKINYQYLHNEGGTTPSYVWRSSDAPDIDFSDSSSYDKKNEVLTSCPDCVTWRNNLSQPDNDKFHFKDFNKNNECDGKILTPKYSKIKEQLDIALDSNEGCMEYKYQYQQEKIENNKWLAKCKYSDSNTKTEMLLYYNNDTYSVIEDNNSHRITSCIPYSNLKKQFESNNNFCPTIIYYKLNKKAITVYSKESSKTDSMLLETQEYYDKNGNKIGDKNQSNNGDEPQSCKDLFDEELINEINKVMNIIKIGVPILLIIFGITDFFRATFNTSEDNMKKDRDRFIKRIIAAIIIFIVPFFVNLVLKISNTVWSNINSETCIK